MSDDWMKGRIAFGSPAHFEGIEAKMLALHAEIVQLRALLHRWVIWNGKDRHHDLLDETRRALEGN